MSGIEYSKVSGHRLMWVMVMFDLPVLTPAEIKEANKFRDFLKDLGGFEMAQYSVYIRFVGSKEKSEKYVRSVKKQTPPPWGGKVDILFLRISSMKISSLLTAENKKQAKKARSIHPILGLRAVFTT